MAVLIDAERAIVYADFMNTVNENGETCGGYLKGDLKAAVNAVDLWVENNKVSYNTALPEPFKSSATAAQKARLLMWVVRHRFLKGA
mgnify:CR=1 FL=1